MVQTEKELEKQLFHMHSFSNEKKVQRVLKKKQKIMHLTRTPAPPPLSLSWEHAGLKLGSLFFITVVRDHVVIPFAVIHNCLVLQVKSRHITLKHQNLIQSGLVKTQLPL